jgi:hypothetical protein
MARENILKATNRKAINIPEAISKWEIKFRM